MAQFRKLYCYLATVYISGVSPKDLKKSSQVNPVGSPNVFPTIQKTYHLQNSSSDETKETNLLDGLQDTIPRKRPSPEKTNESESLAEVEEAFKHSGINTQEHNIVYNPPNGFSHLNNRIISEERIISTEVHPKLISDNPSALNVDKIPIIIQSITQGDKPSKESKPVRSLGDPFTYKKYSSLEKRSNPTSKKRVKKKVPYKKKKSCGAEIPSLSPTSKRYIIEDAKKFARLAGAAYCDHVDLKKWNCTHCVKAGNYKFLKMIEIPILNLQTIILLDQMRKDLVVSFRGSRGMGQAKELISITKKPYKLYKTAEVQIKFEERAEAMFDKISKFLEPIINNYECYCKVLVGHSLGGAIAQLTAPRIGRRFGIPYSDIAVYTFGQPRVGDETFAKWYNGLKIHTIRVVNGRDPVPHTPQAVFGFSHTHRELFLEGSETLCSTSPLEDSNCSNKYWVPVSKPETHKSVWDIKLGRLFC